MLLHTRKKKINGYLSWANPDPNGWEKVEYKCQNCTSLYSKDIPHVKMLPYKNNIHHRNFDHKICLDTLIKNDCLFYDFGIQFAPHIGAESVNQLGCIAHAFDPTPESIEWMNPEGEGDGEWIYDELENYFFHGYGAGAKDGDTTLYEYNSKQVSIIKAREVKNVKRFNLPVKTLGGIMRELKHNYVDVLKLDVEGSEWMFLEQALDEFGCDIPVGQVVAEYHHYHFESRYGTSPEMATIIGILKDCGFRTFSRRPAWSHVRKKTGQKLTYYLLSMIRLF